MFAQASSVVAVASNGLRFAANLRNESPMPIFYQYGGAAVPSQSYPLPPGAEVEERDWNGAINVVVASAGATAPLFMREVGG
jgi:hypothetical protein